MKGMILLALLALLGFSCDIVYKKYNIEDDNIIEEIVEEVISEKTGLDIDLTPCSEEHIYNGVSMFPENVGVNVKVKNDCSQCCPRKTYFSCCCCQDSDNEDEKTKRVSKQTFSRPTDPHKSTFNLHGIIQG